MWSIIVSSKNKLSYKDKDFIANLIDGECHTVSQKYSFILHDILETKNSSEAIIEGKKCAAENIAKVLMSNIKHEVIYKKIKKGRS